MGRSTLSPPYWGWGNFQPARRCQLRPIPLERRLDLRGEDSRASRVGSIEDEALSSSANHPLEGHGGAKKSLGRWPCLETFSWLIVVFLLRGVDSTLRIRSLYIDAIPTWLGVLFLIKNGGPFAFARRVQIEATTGRSHKGRT